MAVLCFDIGGTFIKYACMEKDLTVLSRGKRKTPMSGRAALLDTLAEVFEEVGGAEAIAISMAGIIDPDRGYCVSGGGAMPFNDDFPIREELSRRCPVPIYVENDAKCAAMAEASAGSLQGLSCGLVLIFGTMIGGGIVIDGKLLRGAHLSAGEVSYISTRPDAPITAESVWGNFCGVPHLCALFAARKGLPAGKVDGVTVFDALHRGDEDAVACLTLFCREIAVQIFNLQTVLDPARIAIGGGISADPAFLETIRREYDAVYAQCPYPRPRAEIVGCRFHNDANLIGALQCCLAAGR